MPNLSAWLGNSRALASWRDDIDRTTDTARAIADKSASITIRRAGVSLGAQTVRIEPLYTTAMKAEGANSSESNLNVLITGYSGHATITDTDIQQGDRFYYEGLLYDVKQVVPGISGRLLAIAEASE